MAEHIEICPFCGSNATFVPTQKGEAEYDFERGRVQCVLCGARTEGGEERGVAIAAWNRRHRAGEAG